MQVACANGFWHSLAKIVAGVCDPGPSRTAGLTEASYKDPGCQNPLAQPCKSPTRTRGIWGHSSERAKLYAKPLNAVGAERTWILACSAL